MFYAHNSFEEKMLCIPIIICFKGQTSELVIIKRTDDECAPSHHPHSVPSKMTLDAVRGSRTHGERERESHWTATTAAATVSGVAL